MQKVLPETLVNIFIGYITKQDEEPDKEEPDKKDIPDWLKRMMKRKGENEETDSNRHTEPEKDAFKEAIFGLADALRNTAMDSDGDIVCAYVGRKNDRS